MSAPAPAALSMPIPMGVDALTGKAHAALRSDAMLPFGPPHPFEVARVGRPPVLALHAGVTDASDLTQTGWAVLFASDADPAIKTGLQPLLDLRRSQVNNDKLFKIFEQADGVRPRQPAANWAASRGVSLVAPVDPGKGVPFYLLIVGSLERISYEFQAQFDLQWAVGRLYFDNVADYGAYAQKVVQYETNDSLTQKKRVAVWMPRNALDLSTPLLAGTIAPDFQGQAAGSMRLGSREGFVLTDFVGEGEATKQKLQDIFNGKIDGGPSAVVFTGSHGAEWPASDLPVQRDRQGALVTQEWTHGQPLQPPNYFAGADVPDDAPVQGSMVFLFACFGGGCPVQDSYLLGDDGAALPLTPAPLVSRLPQRLLSLGTLAVIAHIDRAFSYAFQDGVGTPQPQLLRSPLEYLMQGKRVGEATDPLNLQWSSLAAQLGLLLGGFAASPTPPSPALANLFVARDDARNYMVLGDPAVRLRTEKMQGG